MLKMKESTQMTYKLCYGVTGRWGEKNKSNNAKRNNLQKS